jgi:hypothetical protein
MMEYKGYEGLMEVDDDAGSFLTGAIAPMPRISAEFGRSCPGSCPEFPGEGPGTLENEATFP